MKKFADIIDHIRVRMIERRIGNLVTMSFKPWHMAMETLRYEETPSPAFRATQQPDRSWEVTITDEVGPVPPFVDQTRRLLAVKTHFTPQRRPGTEGKSRPTTNDYLYGPAFNRQAATIIARILPRNGNYLYMRPNR